MTRISNNIKRTRQNRGAVWVALLSIAWLQVAFAAHQFDHSAEFVLEDSCHACSHLDRVDDLVADTSACDATISTGECLVATVPVAAAQQPIIHRYHSRGPPCF